MAKHIGNRDALTHALDMALAATVEHDRRRPGEFTAREFYARAVEGGSAMTFNACSKRLKALAERGKYSSRIAAIDGHLVRLYS